MKAEPAKKRAVRNAHELPAGKLKVNMDNALVTAAQRLSLSEKRVMMFAVGKLDAFKADGGTPSGLVKLSAGEYAELFGVDANTAYEQLQGAAGTLIRRQVTWWEEGRKGPKKLRSIGSQRLNTMPARER
jgi:plasmid replication initiation protein